MLGRLVRVGTSSAPVLATATRCSCSSCSAFLWSPRSCCSLPSSCSSYAACRASSAATFSKNGSVAWWCANPAKRGAYSNKQQASWQEMHVCAKTAAAGYSRVSVVIKMCALSVCTYKRRVRPSLTACCAAAGCRIAADHNGLHKPAATSSSLRNVPWRSKLRRNRAEQTSEKRPKRIRTSAKELTSVFSLT